MRKQLRNAGSLAIALAASFITSGLSTAHAQAAAALEQPPAALDSAAAPAGEPGAAPRALELFTALPNGLTSTEAARAALASSFDASAKSESLRAAAARMDEALVAMLPRLQAGARYARLSDVQQPRLLNFPGTVVGTAASPGTLNPPTFALPTPRIRNVLDNYVVQASLIVPVSDYPLRLAPARSAAKHGKAAAEHALIAARAKAAASGRIAYYTWLRALAAERVAEEAVNNRTAHLSVSRSQRAVGNTSRADELRAETAVAAAQLVLERARELTAMTEVQLRIIMHIEPTRELTPGERLDTPLVAVAESLEVLRSTAFSQKSELKAFDALLATEHQSARLAAAAKWPVLSLFGGVQYANPSPRRFPPEDAWYVTWEAGLQATLSPNDVVQAIAAAAGAKAHVRRLEAERLGLRDQVELELQSAYHATRTADASVETSELELERATESHRVAASLYLAGRLSSAEVGDAEIDLTRARFDVLNARTDARIGRVRLALALGNPDAVMHD